MQAIASDGFPIFLIWIGEVVPGETYNFSGKREQVLQANIPN